MLELDLDLKTKKAIVEFIIEGNKEIYSNFQNNFPLWISETNKYDKK